MKKHLKTLTFSIMLLGGALISNSAIASDCDYDVDDMIEGTCTWSENGHYCETGVVPYVSCSFDSLPEN